MHAKVINQTKNLVFYSYIFQSDVVEQTYAQAPVAISVQGKAQAPVAVQGPSPSCSPWPKPQLQSKAQAPAAVHGPSPSCSPRPKPQLQSKARSKTQ